MYDDRGQGAVLADTRRNLGGLEVSAQGLACMGLSEIHGQPGDRRAMIAVARAAFDGGVTLFDTAETYPSGNEDLVGEAIAPFRRQVAIATKFGWNGRREPNRNANSRPDMIRASAEQSLKRLRTDVIDLFYLHGLDPQSPIEDVAGTVRDLIAEGKVRHFGLSDASAAIIHRAHAVLPVSAVQSAYSLLRRGPETDVLPTCWELGIGFVPFMPLAAGHLARAIDGDSCFAADDVRGRIVRPMQPARGAIMAMSALVRDWSRRKQATVAQISLAWLMAQAPWIVPIPGTTQIAHLQDNLGAGTVTFSDRELTVFNADLSRIAAGGNHPTQSSLAVIDG